MHVVQKIEKKWSKIFNPLKIIKQVSHDDCYVSTENFRLGQTHNEYQNP